MEEANLPVEEKLKYIDIIKLISHQTGIGQCTISTTLSEYKKQGTISSPNKNKIRPTITDKIDEFDKKFMGSGFVEKFQLCKNFQFY